MKEIIENEILRVEVDTKGASLLSVYDKRNKKDLLYDAKGVWPNHDVILFPFIGGNKEYSICGIKYEFGGRHGFVRGMEFAPERISPSEIALSIKSCTSTRLVFPYEFSFTMHYRLEENALIRGCEVLNLEPSKGAIPFSYGTHAAYLVEYGKGNISIPGFQGAYPLDEKGDISLKMDSFSIKEGTILNKDIFKKYPTLVFSNPKKVIVVETGRGETIHYSFSSPYIAIWSPLEEPAPFLCVEPWWGLEPYQDEMPFEFTERKALNFCKDKAELEESVSFDLSK